MRRAPLAFVSIVSVCLVLASPGCTAPETGPPGDPGADTDAAAAPDMSADVELGARSARARGCTSCHDPGDGSLSGRTDPLPGTMAFPSNLTPDPETGLGGWTDDQIARAIHDGIDNEMAPLCGAMPRFRTIDPGELRALVAYLRALAAVHHDVPGSSCAPADSERADAGDPDAATVLVVDAGPPPAVEDLAARQANDLALPPMDAASTDAAIACGALINEVQTAGAGGASDEFIELWNPCPKAIDLDGTKLVYRSSAGKSDVVLLQLAAIKLAPGGHLVCANAGFRGAADATYRGFGIASTGGGLALRNAMGAVGDHVAWGDASNAFVRGTAAPAPPASKSIARIPDGRSSGDDARDFTVTRPTPGMANR